MGVSCHLHFFTRRANIERYLTDHLVLPRSAKELYGLLDYHFNLLSPWSNQHFRSQPTY